jgi:hypothetical protein
MATRLKHRSTLTTRSRQASRAPDSNDDGAAARSHLEAGFPIYYSEDDTPADAIISRNIPVDAANSSASILTVSTSSRRSRDAAALGVRRPERRRQIHDCRQIRLVASPSSIPTTSVAATPTMSFFGVAPIFLAFPRGLVPCAGTAAVAPVLADPAFAVFLRADAVGAGAVEDKLLAADGFLALGLLRDFVGEGAFAGRGATGSDAVLAPEAA